MRVGMNKITIVALVTFAASALACSKPEAGAAASTASSTAAPTPPPPTVAAPAQTLPSSVNAQTVDIKAVKQDLGGAPVHVALKSAKTDHDGYIMTFEIENKAGKDIKQLFYYGCTYNAAGKKVGPAPSNGLTVAVKAKAKGTGEVYLGKQSDAPALATLNVNGITYTDGTTWEDKMIMGCPDTVKP